MLHPLIFSLVGFALITGIPINAPASGKMETNIAIQTPSLSFDPMELRSQAQALGLLTLSEVVARNGTATSDLMTTFESNLIRAQEEWIQFQDSPSTARSASAIENFLRLENEASWQEDARIAFYEFHQRLARIRPENRSVHLTRAAIHFAHFKLSKNPLVAQIPIELAELESRLTVRWVSFSEVPTETAGLFVDGHWYDRASGRFPLISHPEFNSDESAQIRLVSVSNSHWPVAVTIRPTETDLSFQVRLKASRPLMPTDSSCTTRVPFVSQPRLLITIDKDQCRTAVLRGESKDEPVALGSMFGLRPINSDPFRDHKPLEPIPRIKPWMWATLGGFALTAILIAQNRNRQESSTPPQPVHRTGW